MHIYDVHGSDTGADEYHCENGRSVVIHDDKPNHIHSWCPINKEPEKMSIEDFI